MVSSCPRWPERNPHEKPVSRHGPFLEAHWGDVHTRMMVYVRNQLNAQLAAELQARVEESLAVTGEDEEARTVHPDVRVVEEPDTPEGSGAAVAETVGVPRARIIPRKFSTPPPVCLARAGTLYYIARASITPGRNQREGLPCVVQIGPLVCW